MTDKLVMKRQPVPNNRFYKWYYGGILTNEEASKMQEENGYHPGGYGFYSYKVEDGMTTWECSDNCD